MKILISTGVTLYCLLVVKVDSYLSLFRPMLVALAEYGLLRSNIKHQATAI